MAGFGTFDIGNVLANVDAIKTARLRDQQLAEDREFRRQELEMTRQDRAEDRAFRREEMGFRRQSFQNALADDARRRDEEAALRKARTGAFAGDEAATAELFGLDPSGAIQIKEYFRGLKAERREQEIAEARQQVEDMGRIAAWVQGQDDPAAAWSQVYANLPEETREGLPEQYDPAFVGMTLAKLMSVEQLLDEVEGKRSQDRFDSALGGALVGSESGGNFGARNDAVGAGGAVGHFGRGQFGVARLEDAKRAGVIPPSMSAEMFLRDEDAQRRVEDWHKRDVLAEAVRNGTYDLIGTEINGVPVTEQGLLNVAHLGGKEGARRFFESGGKYDPKDRNGTHLSDYLALGAQEGGAGAAPGGEPEGEPAVDPRVAGLMQAAGDPSLDETQRDILLRAAELLQPKPTTPDQRYQEVEGVGLVDLLPPGGGQPTAVQFPESELPENFKGEADLRKEFSALPPVKEFQTQANAMQRVADSATDPSAAGDLALIFSYMKLLDPGSVVRETEFANAQNAAGVPDQIRNLWNRLRTGERLNPDQRDDFVGRAAKIYQGAEQQYGALEAQYRNIAEQQRLDPTRTLPSFRYSGEMPGVTPPSPVGAPGAAAAAPGGGGTTRSGVRWSVVPPTPGAIQPGMQ